MEQNNQQTAVDFLYDNIKCCFCNDLQICDSCKILLKQAKQMEKEQIATAYLTGIMHPLEMEATMQSEQYYKETYEKK